jgi:triosephosphate isomerase
MIFATNFKTNNTRNSTRQYVEKLKEFVMENEIKEDILIFPTSTAIDSFSLPKNIQVGVQNAYPVEKGSFTGEIGLEQIAEFGIRDILIGHSERRTILKEPQELIVKKFNYFKERNFEIVYCVGESKEIRDEGFESAMEYIWSEFNGIDISYEKLIVAYEPIWAIGTGVSAKTKDIDEVLSSLRVKIKCPILYGGSVKSSNIKEIISIKDCDGVLIGSASWEVESFCKIIKNGIKG